MYDICNVCMYVHKSVYACMYVNTHSFYKAEIKPEAVKCQSITDKLEAEKEKSGRPGGYPPSQSKIFVFFFPFFFFFWTWFVLRYQDLCNWSLET